MQIKAVYENGVFKPLVPLKLKNEKIQLTIVIPDELLESDHQLSTKNSLRERIDAILGKYAHPRPAVTPSDDKALWHKHLEEKYGS